MWGFTWDILILIVASALLGGPLRGKLLQVLLEVGHPNDRCLAGIPIDSLRLALRRCAFAGISSRVL